MNVSKIIAGLLLALTLSGVAFAAPKGGFRSAPVETQDKTPITTAMGAKELPDDTWVTLRGNVVRQISSDRYLFRDQSGEIFLEIDDDRWGGLTVTPEDRVEISGEVDRDLLKVDIDVKTIRKIGDAPRQENPKEAPEPEKTEQETVRKI